MAVENLFDAINDISRERGIERERLVVVVQESIVAAAKRKFKQYEDVEARITDSGAIEVYRYKTVTEVCEDPDNQISLEEARELDNMAEIGDEVEYEIDNTDLRRVLAQTARQMLFQRLREAEREVIFKKFKDRIGEVLNGTVSRTERGRVYVAFHQTEAVLHPKEQIPNERWASGDHIRVVLLDVLNDPKEPSQLIISRAHPSLLVKLFEMEAPEIYDGVVEIVAAAREPGRRAKIAVHSNDADVDPVGACVGMRGARVQAIISELRGERIDIVQYSDDLTSYLANAIAPAEVARVKVNREEEVIDIEVEPEQLALAIGRHGQNVRLASRLLGFQLNVRSTTDQTKSLEDQIRERLQATLSAQSDAAKEGENAAPSTAQPQSDAAKEGENAAPNTAQPQSDAAKEGENAAPSTAQPQSDAAKEGENAAPSTAQPQSVPDAPTVTTPDENIHPSPADATSTEVGDAAPLDAPATPSASTLGGQDDAAEAVVANPKVEEEASAGEAAPAEAVEEVTAKG